VADSVHMFLVENGLVENVGLNMSMFLSSLSRPFSNTLRDKSVFAAVVPCGPLVVLVILFDNILFRNVSTKQQMI